MTFRGGLFTKIQADKSNHNWWRLWHWGNHMIAPVPQPSPVMPQIIHMKHKPLTTQTRQNIAIHNHVYILGIYCTFNWCQPQIQSQPICSAGCPLDSNFLQEISCWSAQCDPNLIHCYRKIRKIYGNAKGVINSFRLRQNGCNFPDDIFKCIFLNENVWILTKISLKCVSKGPIYNIPTLV